MPDTSRDFYLNHRPLILCGTYFRIMRWQEIFILLSFSFIVHWSYFQSSWDGNDNDHIDVVSLLFLFLVLLYVQSFLFWRGTRPSVWFFRDRKIEGLSSIFFPFLTRYIRVCEYYDRASDLFLGIFIINSLRQGNFPILDRVPGIISWNIITDSLSSSITTRRLSPQRFVATDYQLAS